MEDSKYSFNVFEQKYGKKHGPEMTLLTEEDAAKANAKCKDTCLLRQNEAGVVVVIGYWQEEKRGPHFVWRYVIHNKGNAYHYHIAHGSDYDLLVMSSDVDINGNPIPADDADKHIIGAIKVKGFLQETLTEESNPHDRRVRGEIMMDLKVPMDGSVRILEAAGFPEEFK